VITQGLVAEISGATLWRWLSADALRPWRHRNWIFPRDPDFAAKAGRILDLYDRVWLGRPLRAREFIIPADEKSSIQARRKQPTLTPAPGRSTRVEHEYFREGAWTYLAAWDVHRAKVFGRCEKKSGIAPVGRLIEEVMSREPYKSCPRERSRSQRNSWSGSDSSRCGGGESHLFGRGYNFGEDKFQITDARAGAC
jgi:hypothetical protein